MKFLAVLFAFAPLFVAETSQATSIAPRYRDLITCSAHFENSASPIIGYNAAVVFDYATNTKQFRLAAVCPSCRNARIMPTFIPVTREGMKGTVKTYVGKGVSLKIHMESLIPTQTHMGTLRYVGLADAGPVSVVCQQTATIR
jgi:hypothetical protein